jgi:hypothetical protein
MGCWIRFWSTNQGGRGRMEDGILVAGYADEFVNVL